MQCPKDKTKSLRERTLSNDLLAQQCATCGGTWMTAAAYQQWQERRTSKPVAAEEDATAPDIQFEPSPLDAKAALCPNCGHYLSRARVGTYTPFYIERCAHCGGIWCDGGEWDVLEQSGLSLIVPFLFSETWQTSLRERESAEHERRELRERLGPELAERVSLFADELKAHPHRDYALAYLMRTVGQREEPV